MKVLSLTLGFLLSLALLYNIKFSQILIQILMKSLDIKIFIISAVEISITPLIFHHIRVIIIIKKGNLQLSLGRNSLKSFSLI